MNVFQSLRFFQKRLMCVGKLLKSLPLHPKQVPLSGLEDRGRLERHVEWSADRYAGPEGLALHGILLQDLA